MSNNAISYSIDFPFTDCTSVLSVEEKWRKFLEEKENDDNGFTYLPGSVEFNDRIRAFKNLTKLLKENMDGANYKKKDILEILKFIAIFSMQVNAMNVTERALRQRLVNDYMKKLWIYLSHVHCHIGKIFEKNIYNNAFTKVFTEAIKGVFPFFAELLEHINSMESILDNLIKYTKHKPPHTLDDKIKKARIRPYKYLLAPAIKEQETDDFEFFYSLLSPDEKLNVIEPDVTYDRSQLDSIRDEMVSAVLERYIQNNPEISNDDIEKKQLKDNLKSDFARFLKIVCTSCVNDIKLKEMTDQTKELLEQNFIITKEKMDNVKNMISDCLNKYLPKLPESPTSKNVIDAEFYLGLLYEFDCFEVVFKMLSTFETYQRYKPTQQQILQFLQAIVILGEAVNGANGIRLFVDRDWTIVGKLIYLRNRLSKDVFFNTKLTIPVKNYFDGWKKQDINGYTTVKDFIENNWENLIKELLTLNAKFKGRLDVLQKCFDEPDSQKLQKLLISVKEMGFTYLYDTPLNDIPCCHTKNKKQNEKNKRAWSKHEYPYLNLFSSTLQLIPKTENHTAVSISDIIGTVVKLENVCFQIFNTKKPDHQTILNVLKNGYEGNNFAAFLQLHYHINHIYQKFNNYITDKNFQLNVYSKSYFHLFEHIYVLLRNGRNMLFHDFWMKEYNTLASIVCLILSNFKLICNEYENGTKVNQADLTFWWHLLLIKYVHKIIIGKENNAMRYGVLWASKHAINTPNIRHVMDLSVENGEKLLKIVQEVIEKFMKVFLTNDSPKVKSEKFEELCQRYKIFEPSLRLIQENVFGFSEVIESIMEQGILCLVCGDIEPQINYYVNSFKKFLEENRNKINLNTCGLHLRTPLMYVLSLYDHDPYNNEMFCDTIKQLVGILIEHGADPDVYSPLTLHTMHYAAFGGKIIKDYMEERCNLSNPPEGTLGLTANDFFDNYRIFNVRIVGDTDNVVHSFYNPMKFADMFHDYFPYKSGDCYPYLYNAFGETLLISAVKTGYANFRKNLEGLLKLNADINQKEIIKLTNGEAVFGDTPLLKALKIQQTVIIKDNIDVKAEIIELLLKNGADPTITDSEMKNSVDIAKENYETAKKEKNYWKNEYRGLYQKIKPDDETLDNAYNSAKYIYKMLNSFT